MPDGSEAVLTGDAALARLSDAEDFARASLLPPRTVHGTHGTHSMTSRLANLHLDAVDPARVASFWCEVLGWQILDADEDVGLVEIGPVDGRWPGIDIMRVPEPKTVKNRLHIDLRADGLTPAEELTRLLALGASRTSVGQGEDVSWVVLADPEGNEFCLLSRSVQDLPDGDRDPADRR